MSNLEYNLDYAKEALRDFATGPNFLANLETAFGNDLDSQKAAELAAEWGAGDFSGLPGIEVRPKVEINGAMGAFSGDTNTIYFSQEFLSANVGNGEAVAGVWLEEVGHFVDSLVNSEDAAGDEGEIFSRLVRGDVLSGLELLRSEDDGAVVVLDGVEVAIEMNTLSGDGAIVEDKIDPAFDEDEFTFAGKAGDIVTLGVDNLSSGGLDLILLNPDGSFLTSDLTSGDPELTRIALQNNGTYTVIVDGFESNTGEYVLGLSNLRQDSTGNLSGDGATLNGTIDFIFDEDTFTFKGQSGDIVSLGVDNLSSGGLDLILLNPDGSFLTSDLTSGDPELTRIALPNNGTYTVIVDGFDSNTGEYVVGLSNLRQDSATPLLENGTIATQAIDFIFDEDAFTFKGKAGDIVTLGVDNLSSGGLDLILLNPDGSFLTSDLTSGDPELTRIALPNNGTYTVIVDGFDSNTGEYTLSASGLSSQDPTGSNKKDNLEGNRIDNKINGKGGDDRISGGGGNDQLDGGKGNDNLDGGTGNDRLSGGNGNDRLDGGKGADILNGGGGNDTYIIDNAKDKIQEKGNGGTDTVQTSINININIFNNVENIVLTGKKPLKGTGNRGKNQIDGNRGKNQIDGKAGNDIINGGGGNDNLLGGEGNDIVNGGSGNDVINGDVGNDTLTGGSGNDILIGDAGKDELSGGSGNDRLTGGAGNDILTGDGGKDRFIYDSDRRFRKKDFGADRITDFVRGQDDIVLDLTTFDSLESKAGNRLVANDFAIITDNASAATSSAEIVYNSSNGQLFYNANGSEAGFGGGGRFATLTNEPALSRSDFIVQN